MNAVTPPKIRPTWINVVRHKLCVLAALLVAVAQLEAGSAWGAALLSGNGDFKLLASSLGFEQAVDGPHAEGSRLNNYAWSMAWFKGKLYVGTARFETNNPTGQPGAGQIWVYTPGGPGGASGTWALAYQSPLTLLRVPREFGYRWMTTCTFGRTEYLFISTLGTSQGNILRTSDGVTFTPLSRVGFPAGSVGFRTMVCFTEPNGSKLLVTSPVGKGGSAATFDPDRSDNPIALANDSPSGLGTWRSYSPLRMNDPDNDSFFTLYATGGMLYAGVTNPVAGTQVWRTPGCSSRGTCQPQWSKLIDRGGGRPLGTDGFAQNTGVSDMIAYGNALYMGVSTSAGQRITAELWRLRADNTLEILIGEPRLNFGTNPDAPPTNPAFPTNLRCGPALEDIDAIGGANDCPPTTRRGAGLGDTSTAAGGYPDGSQFYFWRLLNYAHDPIKAPLGDNRLYLGTLEGFGGGVQRIFGFDILASTDGIDWSTITNDGLGDPNQGGMRTIASSPIGLFIGGANFPSQNPNDVEGCDVWLGVPQPDTQAPVTTISTPPAPAEGATIGVRDVSFGWTGTDTPAGGSLPLTYAYRLDPLEPGFSSFGAGTGKTYTRLPSGTYTFYAIAKDAAGNTEAPGAAPGAGNRRTFIVNAPDLPPTVAIQVGPASPNTTGSASFVWQGSDDLTPTANLTYDFWLAPLQSDTGSFTNVTTAGYGGLTDGAFTFHVKAKDGANNVGAETTFSFTVARTPSPPAAPSTISAAVIAARVLQVNWTDVANETSYNLQRCVTAGRFCSFAPLASNLPAGTTSYSDTVAAAGAYGYRVQSCNALGCSGWVTSNRISVP